MAERQTPDGMVYEIEHAIVERDADGLPIKLNLHGRVGDESTAGHEPVVLNLSAEQFAAVDAILPESATKAQRKAAREEFVRQSFALAATKQHADFKNKAAVGLQSFSGASPAAPEDALDSLNLRKTHKHSRDGVTAFKRAAR